MRNNIIQAREQDGKYTNLRFIANLQTFSTSLYYDFNETRCTFIVKVKQV